MFSHQQMLCGLIAVLSVSCAFAQSCADAKACNEAGTGAYQAAKYSQAIELFTRQIDFAESLGNDTNGELLAYNNAALAAWKQGQCLVALQYIRLAENSGGSKATAFNKQSISKACQAQISETAIAGEYWQYAGSGQWNQLTIAPSSKGGGEYVVTASVVYVTRAPLAKNPGAINVGGLRAVGRFGLGYASGSFANDVFLGTFATEDAKDCALQINMSKNSLEAIAPNASKRPECAIGGLNVSLGSIYYQVSKGKQGLAKSVGRKMTQNFPAPAPFVLPKLSPLAGKWVEVSAGKAGLEIFEPCDAQTRFLIFDSVNDQVHAGMGQEVVFFEVQSLKASPKRQFDLRAKMESADQFGSMRVHTNSDGSINVKFPDPQWEDARFVDERTSFTLPTVADNSCDG
jgi:hypothetical protein